jgi:hypothetical protein
VRIREDTKGRGWNGRIEMRRGSKMRRGGEMMKGGEIRRKIEADGLRRFRDP